MATNLAIAALLSVTNTPRTKRRQETDRGIGKVASNPAPTDERIRRIIAKAATSLNLAPSDAERSRARRAGDHAHRPDGNDLRPECRQTVLAIDRGDLR